MAQNDKLGSEWGSLAGLPRDEALKILAEYAADLEDQVDAKTGAGGNSGDTPDDEDEEVDGRRVAKMLKSKQTEPLANEFVGRREAAKSKAAQQIRAANQDWNRLEDYVVQVMSNATPDLQTQPEAWVEAWWYVWGLEQRTQALNAGQEPPPEEDDGEDEYIVDDEYDEPEEPDTPIPPRPEQNVRAGNMNSDRSTRQPRRKNNENRINDPTERRTKRHFEQYLGRKIPDKQWLEMREANTLEDYERITNQGSK